MLHPGNPRCHISLYTSPAAAQLSFLPLTFFFFFLKFLPIKWPTRVLKELLPKLWETRGSKGKTRMVVKATLPAIHFRTEGLISPAEHDLKEWNSLFPSQPWANDWLTWGHKGPALPPRKEQCWRGSLNMRVESLLWLHHSWNLPICCFLPFPWLVLIPRPFPNKLLATSFSS